MQPERASFVDRPRRYPKLASSNTGSKIGSNRLSRACWHTNLSDARERDTAQVSQLAVILYRTFLRHLFHMQRQR